MICNSVDVGVSLNIWHILLFWSRLLKIICFVFWIFTMFAAIQTDLLDTPLSIKYVFWFCDLWIHYLYIQAITAKGIFIWQFADYHFYFIIWFFKILTLLINLKYDVSKLIILVSQILFDLFGYENFLLDCEYLEYSFLDISLWIPE